MKRRRRYLAPVLLVAACNQCGPEGSTPASGFGVTLALLFTVLLLGVAAAMAWELWRRVRSYDLRSEGWPLGRVVMAFLVGLAGTIALLSFGYLTALLASSGFTGFDNRDDEECFLEFAPYLLLLAGMALGVARAAFGSAAAVLARRPWAWVACAAVLLVATFGTFFMYFVILFTS